MLAYQEMIQAKSTDYAPWYVIPADNKKYMRMNVAKIIVETLQAMKPQFPEVDAKEKAKFDEMREKLNNEN